MIRDLTESEIKNLLSSQILGRLSCTDGEIPYIVPVTYLYDGRYIYGQTNIGKKLRMLRKNPNVCFEVDTLTDMFNWKSVLVYGEFEELEKKEAEKAREKMSENDFTLMTGCAIHPHQHAVVSGIDDNNRKKLIMYRIKIKELTGRQETR